MFTLYRIIFAPFQKLLQYSVNKNQYSVAVQKLFPGVPSVIRSPIRHTTCNAPFSFEGIIRGSDAISAPIKVFRLDQDRFKTLFDTEGSTFNSRAEQFCSGAESASKATFLLGTEALSGPVSGTLSSTLRFTTRFSVNTTLASTW